MTTNKIEIDKNKSFIIPFVRTILCKKNKGDKLIADKFYHLLEILVATTPRVFHETKDCSELEIRFELPNWNHIDTNYRNYICKINQRILINWLYQKFYFVFDTFMQNKQSYEVQAAIYFFIDSYDLSIDNFEMLKKRDYRNRKLIKNKKISSHFVESSSFKEKRVIWT